MTHSLKILVVEDQVITAENIKETLEGTGHRVVGVARTYDEAVLAAVKYQPELIIMDIELKGASQDGIQTAADIRSAFYVPVVFLTGKEDGETFKRASEVHPEGYLLKPFKSKDLVYQVDMAHNKFINSSLNRGKSGSPDTIYVWDGNSHVKIRRSEVVFMEAKRVFTAIYSIHEPGPLLVTMNLGHISGYFPEDHFYRLSQSFLINLNFLQQVKDNELFFEGIQKTINISDNKKTELKKRLTIIRSPRTVR